jgi:hypothetical protein
MREKRYTTDAFGDLFFNNMDPAIWRLITIKWATGTSDYFQGIKTTFQFLWLTDMKVRNVSNFKYFKLMAYTGRLIIIKNVCIFYRFFSGCTQYPIFWARAMSNRDIAIHEDLGFYSFHYSTWKQGIYKSKTTWITIFAYMNIIIYLCRKKVKNFNKSLCCYMSICLSENYEFSTKFKIEMAFANQSQSTLLSNQS